MFIKRGGHEKIISVVEPEELSTEQKKAAKDLSGQLVASEENSPNSKTKKSGN